MLFHRRNSEMFSRRPMCFFTGWSINKSFCHSLSVYSLHVFWPLISVVHLGYLVTRTNRLTWRPPDKEGGWEYSERPLAFGQLILGLECWGQSSGNHVGHTTVHTTLHTLDTPQFTQHCTRWTHHSSHNTAHVGHTTVHTTLHTLDTPQCTQYYTRWTHHSAHTTLHTLDTPQCTQHCTRWTHHSAHNTTHVGSITYSFFILPTAFHVARTAQILPKSPAPYEWLSGPDLQKGSGMETAPTL